MGQPCKGKNCDSDWKKEGELDWDGEIAFYRGNNAFTLFSRNLQTIYLTFKELHALKTRHQLCFIT